MKRVKHAVKYAATLVAMLFLAACGTAPATQDLYAECKIPVIRKAGLGVKLPGCAYWVFK